MGKPGGVCRINALAIISDPTSWVEQQLLMQSEGIQSSTRGRKLEARLTGKKLLREESWPRAQAYSDIPPCQAVQNESEITR